MTSGEKLFFFIINIGLLVASIMPVEFSIVPKINCDNLNNNQFSDFIAFSDSDFPRTIYHLEPRNSKLEILWEYKMPKDVKGYFIDLILNDFDNDGNVEIIAISYQENNDKIFYIFSSNDNMFNNSPPLIVSIQDAKSKINNPTKLHSISSDKTESPLFILTQGSPNRQITICEFYENKIFSRGSIGEKFLDETFAPIDIALGDFDNNKNEDIFILNNGFVPEGYIVYADGREQKLDLTRFPKIKILNSKGVDLNFDDKDEIVFITNNSELMTNIWNGELVALKKNKIQNIIIKSNDGLIYLSAIEQKGGINNYVIDPVTKRILSSEFTSPQFINNYDKVHSISTSEEIILSHDGDDSELWIYNMPDEFVSESELDSHYQKIYYRQPDYVINIGETFYHEIQWPENTDFRNFIEEEFPDGMDFNIKNVRLEWAPGETQLGYHQLSYSLDLRQKGKLELGIKEGKKIVRKEETEMQNFFSYLIYVNDFVKIKPISDNLTIINNQLFEWEIPIDDKNADAKLEVKILDGNNNATIKVINTEILLIADTLETSQNILLDLVNSDTNIVNINTISLDKPIEVFDSNSVYIDTIKTEFEQFTETKTELEDDPLKKKKLEESDEDFKLNEEEYREKLKTHKKILRDGKNIWVPIDSLNNISDKTDSLDTIIIADQPMKSSIDTISIDVDSLLIDTGTSDSSFVEISYRETITYKAFFSWTPKVTPDEYEFILFASDGFSMDTNSIIIKVHPEIDLSMNKDSLVATVDKVFTSTILLNQEPRSPQFYYDLINAPENMKIDSIGNINWVPIPTQVDDYNFEIQVSDGIATKILPINIYVNAPPVISSRPPKTYFLSINEKLNFPLESFDLNKNTYLQWKLVSGPTGMNLLPNGILEWNNPKLGHHPYEIQLNDGIDSVQWKANIYVNATPEITSTPLTVIEKNNDYIYNITAWDANKMSPYDSLIGNNLSFSLVQGPEGLNIDGNNTLNWNTENVPLGEYMVAITASDGVDEDIQVFPVFINSPPTITSLDSITIQVGNKLSFQIQAIDNNIDDTLTFHLDPLLGDMIMELHSGLLTWIPQKEDMGINIFRLQVKDGHDINGTFMELIIFVYDLPQLTSSLSSEAFTEMEYSEFLTAKDMNGKKLDFPESITIDSATFNYYNLSQYAHLFKWTPRDVDKGNHELIIKLIDEYGFIAFHKHDLTVFSNPCVHCNNDEKAPADSTKK